MKRFFAGLWREIALPVAIVLLLFAVGAGQLYLEVPPASAYVDEGVHTFTAVSGYPTTREGHYQKKYHRYSEMHVYVVVYKAGSWSWERDFLIEAEGKEALQNREQVERRVLSLVDENRYVTAAPELTPQRFVAKQRRKYLILGCVCAAVPVIEGVVYLLRRGKTKPSNSL